MRLHRLIKIKPGSTPVIIKKKEQPVVFGPEIYQHPRYKKWRRAVFQRDNYTCQLCGGKGKLEAHHIIKKATAPELVFSIDNGVCLCLRCHQKFVTGNEKKCEKMFQDMVAKKKVGQKSPT